MDQTLPDLLAGAPTPESAPTRRRVLALVAATGAGGALLTACGGGDSTESDSPAAEGSASGSSDDAASPSESAAGGGALVATSKVPVGGGVILQGPRIVVTQPTEGDFKAFTAVCTHMSCVVSSVKDDTISCACHGSAYSAADGSVKNGPATRPLREIAVSVEGGDVVEA